MNHDDVIEAMVKCEKPFVMGITALTVCTCAVVELFGWGRTPWWFAGGVSVAFCGWYFARHDKATENRKPKTENNNPNKETV